MLPSQPPSLAIPPMMVPRPTQLNNKSANTREEDVNNKKNNGNSLVHLRSVKATHFLSNHTSYYVKCVTGSPGNRGNNHSYPIN